MEKLSKEQEIIKLLFKDSGVFYNSRNLSKIIGISHAGAFKILKKLEKRNIVRPLKIGKAVIYSINKENPVALKEIELTLVIEAQNYLKWIDEFKIVKDEVGFLVLFGSIIRNEKSALDIDILVVADKSKLNLIKKLIYEREKFLTKKIHLLLQTPEDFKKDITCKNKVVLEIVKTGIVLFGQDEFRRLI